MGQSRTYMKQCLDRRRAGILLHITSLPGRAANGDLGVEARNFVNFLAAAGITVWQTLPLGPTKQEGSPYQTRSVHAGDPRMISLESLVQRGWLESSVLRQECVSFECKREALLAAWEGFKKLADKGEREALIRFLGEQRFWLDDYGLFQALRSEQKLPWWEWAEGIRDREPQALAQARSRLAEEIEYVCFEQYLFFCQWQELKHYAGERGVLLFGDMPIFVALDSAEVWAHREIFQLDEDGRPTVVAGVPPDYFSDTGQRWGNPLYRWDAMARDGFSFWVQRLKTQLKLFDLIRIDHFRGFAAYWEIPAADGSAINGHWRPAAGQAVFELLHKQYDPLPIVAEDLGIITPEVEQLRDRFGMPGMNVLQFAFNGDTDNPYLPFQHKTNSVVYTGTHDNDTTLGWYRTLGDSERRLVNEYLGFPGEPMPWPIIRTALASRARLAMIPMQDVLALDGEHRMNLPGTIEGNWRWRFRWDQVEHDLATRLRHMVGIYGRLG